MVLADWSKISGADLQLIKKACHLNYGAVSTGSESRYIHNGTENHFYVSQGMSTWFALVKPSSGTAKMKIGGIFKYYDNSNYVYSYLEIEIDSNGNIVSAKVVYGKVDGGQVVVELEEDVTDKIQHLSGMIVGAEVDVDDFEDGTTQGWEGDVSVVDEGYEGAKSLKVDASGGALAYSSWNITKHGYKSVGDSAVILVLAKRVDGCRGYPTVGSFYEKIEGVTPPSGWGWMTFYEFDDTLDIECHSEGECGGSSCGCDSRVFVDTVKFVSYADAPWAFIKFYGYLKQIEGKWYLDIEARVSNNYYTSPDTSVEPPTTIISSCLIEIPNTIVGNNTKCGIILGREASDWINQNCPNVIIDYTKLFY